MNESKENKQEEYKCLNCGKKDEECKCSAWQRVTKVIEVYHDKVINNESEGK